MTETDHNKTSHGARILMTGALLALASIYGFFSWSQAREGRLATRGFDYDQPSRLTRVEPENANVISTTTETR